MILRCSSVLASFSTLLLFFSGCATADPNQQSRSAMLTDIGAEPQGDYFIGRRYYKVDYKFWGYIRKPGESWANARMVMLNEQQKLAPDRELGKLGSDNGYEYKLYGTFSGDTVYEPASNGFYPEFVLKGYELKNVSPAPIFKVVGALDPQRRVIAKPVLSRLRRAPPLVPLRMANAPDAPLAPPRLSEQELEDSMRKNVAAGALGTVWQVAIYGLPLPLFMQAIHASGFQLGLMAAVRQAAMLAQLPSAFIVERLHQRKPYWAVIATIHRSLWLTPAFLPFLWPSGTEHWVVVLIVALGLSDILGNASTAPWLSWMADLLPAGRAGRFWGRRQRLLSAVVFIAALSFGGILDAATSGHHGLTGFSIVFAIAALFGVGDIVVHSGVIEPAQLRSAPGQSFWRRLAVPLRSRDFRRLTLALGVWTAALALPGYFYGTPGFFNVVYLHETFGATYSEASWLILASAFGAVLWSHPIGHRIDRFGARLVAMGLIAVGPLFTLAWFFASPGKVALPLIGAVPQPVLLMSAASLVIGGFYAGMQLCQYRLTQALTPNTGRTVAMAVHWSSVGLIGSCGALAGGWIKDHMPPAWSAWTLPGGTPFSYFHVLILLQVLLAWGVALPLLASVKEPRQTEH